MSIEDKDKIDIVARGKDGSVRLVVTDHLPWGDDAHLFQLQEKLNSYVAYIETGQVCELDGVTEATPVSVEVVCKFEPDETGKDFFFRAGEVMAKAGIPLRHRTGA